MNSTVSKEERVDSLLQPGYVETAVRTKHSQLTGKAGNLASLGTYLATLDSTNVSSIPMALDYIKTCIAKNDPDNDKVFQLYNEYFYKLTNRLSDSLGAKYDTLIYKMYADSNALNGKAFINNLAACGIGLFSTEGTNYLDALSDHFYSNFKDRVSVPVAEYLNIRKDEMAEGFSEDAGMLISFKQLHQRIKRWERYAAQYPNSPYAHEANGYYSIYLETLITGMDNTRTFDFDSNTLLPEVKVIYEHIMEEDTASATTHVIRRYYQLLSKNDFKDNDSIHSFLENEHLETMLAVQPHNR